MQLGTIYLSESKKRQISELIASNREADITYVGDGHFRSSFLNIVNGKIDEKLEIMSPSTKSDNIIDELYYQQFEQNKKDLKYKLMLKKRVKLPAYELKDQIVDIIAKNQVCVISGETGCGKTTQVAQFILDDYIMRKKASACKIICTQPRRISAISIAMRVAEERAEKLGNSVGYQIRLEK